MNKERIKQIIINALENNREGIDRIGYIKVVVDRRDFERVSEEAAKKIIAEQSDPQG